MEQAATRRQASGLLPHIACRCLGMPLAVLSDRHLAERRNPADVVGFWRLPGYAFYAIAPAGSLCGLIAIVHIKISRARMRGMKQPWRESCWA